MIIESCPKCGKPGFLTKRWVRSAYYPMYASMVCLKLEGAEFRLSRDPNNVLDKDTAMKLRREIRGDHYRGESEYHLLDRKDREYFDRETAYRVSSRRYFYDYIGHYSPEKYQEEMERFKSGKRKSRPNGRIWHKVPVKNDCRKSDWY